MRHRFDPWIRKILWRRKWQPTSVFLTENSHRQRSLVGYSPWDCRDRHNSMNTRVFLHIYIWVQKRYIVHQSMASEGKQPRDERDSSKGLGSNPASDVSSHMTLSQVISLCQYLHLSSEDGRECVPR